jgi:Domain of unknown function (DUF4430)
VTRWAAALLVAAAALTGCGAADNRDATIWITRDRGAHVMLVRKIPSGLTAMQGLDRVADISTRYSGKYVQSINGVAGSLTKQRDWFYFVNGYEGDRSAAEYRLHKGDVEWWDFRSWNGSMSVPVVVGAFPEPFLHGYGGKTLPACVVGQPKRAVTLLARALRAGRDCRGNRLVLKRGESERFFAHAPQQPGAPVTFTYVGDPMRLARNLHIARFRYSIP